MFEVGRTYEVVTADHEGLGSITKTVLEVDLPLVKFSRPGNYEIINVSSPYFVSATPNDEKAKADEAAETERFRSSFGIKINTGDEY